MKTMDLPPYAPTLIESTRAIGYSLETAAADIIDNSIAAGANMVNLSFFPIGESYISILDNGFGMDADKLNTAMQYGSRNPIDARDAQDLGRFGLGLKTASLSQCRCLTVISKQADKIEGRRWDIDYVSKTGMWSLIILEKEEMNDVPNIDGLLAQDSGTLVVWRKLDRLKSGETDFEQVMGRRIDSVREHLSLVFHRYLSGEKGITKLKISINGQKISASDPFLESKSTQAMDDEILLVHGQKITVRAYILPHISKMTQKEREDLGGKEGLRRQQGFYIYRNKRLLVWGTWFRMRRQDDLSKLARIRVDIPNTLDDLWTLDIKKSSALPPAEVRKNLEIIIEKIAERSKRTWTFRGKRETDDRSVHIWNRMKNTHGGFYYEINRVHPMVEQILRQAPNVSVMLNELLKQIETGIPLNQLYVDLNNEEQLVNGQEQNEQEVKEALKNMLAAQTTAEEKLALLVALEGIEPFSQHPLVVSELKKEVL
ncbi:MAG: ATP-binding protein [Oscillospiraceae bacterium]|jgi:hypothetical protein|nr:ATP-binding protein [Oscillospiraceae bacterium]